MADGSIDEVFERSTVEFRYPIALEQTESLLGYLCTELPAEIRYAAGRHVSISPTEVGSRSCDEGACVNVVESVSLSGDVTRREGSHAFDHFDCEVSDADNTLVYRLKFFMTPGWSISEYRPEILQLRDDVKRLVAQYFEERRR
jgi:hypothetical protein